MVGEGEGDGQLWGSGRGAIAGCHCSVLWWGKGRVTANFGGVDVVPLGWHCSWGEGDQLQGAIVVGRVTTNIAGCHCSVLWLGGHFSSTLTTPKLFFAIWGLCWYNFLMRIELGKRKQI